MTPSNRAYRASVFAAAVTALAALSSPLRAAEPESAAGARLAQQYCAKCHVVGPTGSGSWTDAPSFVAVAGRPGTTAATLSAFIQKPHMHMLNTGRPPKEADQLAAYIMSLRP